MLDSLSSAKALKSLFRRTIVADMEELFRTLKTRSRMSVFRRLREEGYRSSCTHAGRYYTLLDVPKFDERGLWFYQDIGFSRFGTLKATLIALADTEPGGFTHEEIEGVLHLRVHNTLLDLVREGSVVRSSVEGTYLYISAKLERGDEQKQRRAEVRQGRAGPEPLATTTVIEVLVEALKAGRVRVSTALVAGRLRSRGLDVTVEQVAEVFRQYGVEAGKETVPGSKRSRG